MTGDGVFFAVLTVLAAAAAAACRRRPREASVGAALVALALTGYLGLRWFVAGRPPVFGTAETNVAEALVVLFTTAWLRRRVGADYLRAPLWAVAVLLAHTLVLRREITPLTISEQSLWIDVHAPLAWLTLALYLHAVFLAFGGERVQGEALRALGLAFCAHSAMGFVGVYYASVLFARPWEWDPVQTLGLLAWVLAGLTLHFRLFSAISLSRQRHAVVAVVVAYVLSAKLIMYLPLGMSFHVFELGSMR